MGWLHRKSLFDMPSGTQGHIVIDPFGGRPHLDGMIYPDSTYQTYARQGYGRNELVYSCIMYKARTLPQGILRVYAESAAEPLESHPLRQLVAQPNPACNELEFLQLSVVHLDLSGNCYWLILYGRNGLPAELWPIRPDLIRIIPSRTDVRDWDYGYILDPESINTGRSPEVIPIRREDIIHIRYPNPLDMYFGQAPLRPTTRAVAVDNARTDFVDALLRNDAVPRTVVTTQQEIDQGLIDRLEERWSRKFGGINRGKPAFLQAGMDVKVLGMNLTDLEFGDLTGVTESRICMPFGVQPILVGAKVGLDRSTFANFKEAKIEFWETTLMDLQRMFLEGFRHQVMPYFVGVGRRRIDMRWDNSGVLALQEAESAKWERATNALARGGITQNDFRRTVGLDPVPDGDRFLMPAGVVPMPIGAEPVELDQPEPELQAAGYAGRFLRSLSHSNGDRPMVHA